MRFCKALTPRPVHVLAAFLCISQAFVVLWWSYCTERMCNIFIVKSVISPLFFILWHWLRVTGCYQSCPLCVSAGYHTQAIVFAHCGLLYLHSAFAICFPLCCFVCLFATLFMGRPSITRGQRMGGEREREQTERRNKISKEWCCSPTRALWTHNKFKNCKINQGGIIMTGNEHKGMQRIQRIQNAKPLLQHVHYLWWNLS